MWWAVSVCMTIPAAGWGRWATGIKAWERWRNLQGLAVDPTQSIEYTAAICTVHENSVFKNRRPFTASFRGCEN